MPTLADGLVTPGGSQTFSHPLSEAWILWWLLWEGGCVVALYVVIFKKC